MLIRWKGATENFCSKWWNAVYNFLRKLSRTFTCSWFPHSFTCEIAPEDEKTVSGQLGCSLTNNDKYWTAKSNLAWNSRWNATLLDSQFEEFFGEGFRIPCRFSECPMSDILPWSMSPRMVVGDERYSKASSLSKYGID